MRQHRLRMERLETRRLLATWVVTSTIDAVDLIPGDGVCEISSDGPCTLRAAIQEANALENVDGPDRIELSAGTYTLSLAGTDDQDAQTGDLDIRQDLILQGAGAIDTIIDGGGIDRVMDVVSGVVVIDGVTIRGGVIENEYVWVEGSGGGIRNEGELTIAESTITGNIATNGAGVANYNGILQISRSVIFENGDHRTARGGGVANYAYVDAANLEITDSTIANNRADAGGGINNYSYDGMAAVMISRSTISGNRAENGGGLSNRSVVYDYAPVVASLTIQNSTISGNEADLSGGGIHNEADDGSDALIDIASSTIAANTATTGDGGGIRNVTSAGASTSIESVIVSGNHAGGQGADLAGDLTSVTFSLIEHAEGHSVVDGVNHNIVGEDPRLGPLADNGGLTLTHSLLNGSPAIDQGSNPNAVSTDQRDSPFVRLIDDLGINNAGDGTDIGAVEVGQVGDPPPKVADLSLTQTVSDANPTLGQEVTFTITLVNDGPDRATSVEVRDILPLDLVFTGSAVSQGAYDDLDGVWRVGDLDAESSAVLSITTIVDSTDSLTNTAEVTASDQVDPDSTPANGILGEDDQVSLAIGTCLAGEPIHAGLNQLSYSCATPGSLVGFVRGTERGSHTFQQFGITVDIVDAEEVAIAIADTVGVAVALIRVTDAEFDALIDPELTETILVQAFELIPNSQTSNTLAYSSDSQNVILGSLDIGLPQLPTTNTNSRDRLDVNGDTIVSALDALIVVNQLSQESQRIDGNTSVLVGGDESNVAYFDTNADFRVSALDALLVINYLSRAQAVVASGEATATTDSIAPDAAPVATPQPTVIGASMISESTCQAVRSFASWPLSERESTVMKWIDDDLPPLIADGASILENISADISGQQPNIPEA